MLPNLNGRTGIREKFEAKSGNKEGIDDCLEPKKENGVKSGSLNIIYPLHLLTTNTLGWSMNFHELTWDLLSMALMNIRHITVLISWNQFAEIMPGT